MGAFEEFLLAAAEKAPFLVGEVAPTVVQRKSQKRDRGGDAVTGEGSRVTKQPATHEEEVARLQRLLVDGPLQPLGLEHAVYHVLLPAFTAAVGAAREVWRATAALRAGEADATQQGSGESAGASADPNANATGTPSGTPPSVQALQRVLVAAQAKLTAQRQLLDAAEAKLRATVEAVTSTCATVRTP
ncbi:hypothetical protein TraAM80_06603 [Trypanosoma rangeli]|uniref:Uncharacterized protein n=1 Tax=Trypanosoma rangeli TaxID=5698 RepID=A0A422N9Q2_TRYRA|nr:uncharacterized protein TraAM80_06603 [Trypanosoma rangeli]RNF02190.1 hypothetical protein TraAM80_06603 [Trypanosoma rangeli]|eukprot:RNF02190.1 hypothetical protein TraAM80_06603 [Trypanosoma rangeli]